MEKTKNKSNKNFISARGLKPKQHKNKKDGEVHNVMKQDTKEQ